MFTETFYMLHVPALKHPIYKTQLKKVSNNLTNRKRKLTAAALHKVNLVNTRLPSTELAFDRIQLTEVLGVGLILSCLLLKYS